MKSRALLKNPTACSTRMRWLYFLEWPVHSDPIPVNPAYFMLVPVPFQFRGLLRSPNKAASRCYDEVSLRVLACPGRVCPPTPFHVARDCPDTFFDAAPYCSRG